MALAAKSSALLIDNFTLQDVGGVLTHGPASDLRAEIRASSSKKGYVVRGIPAAAIQIEALLQLLNVIVLQDELIVDSKFTASWEDALNFLAPLRTHQIVAAKPFDEAKSAWLPRRDFAEQVLCFTPQLACDFDRYKAAFPNVAPNAAMSTLVWGTAGMLARSHYLDTPYLGHPSRARLIDLSAFSPVGPSATAIVTEFVVSERAKFFERAAPGSTARFASLSVPPVALEVVAEARDAAHLIPVAVQLRDKYRKMRGWIAEYQRALEAGPADAAKYKGLLEAAASDLAASFKPSWWSDLAVSLNFGLSVPKVSKSVPIESTLHRFMPWTIRSALIRLIKRSWDEKTLDKLFSILGADDPRMRTQILGHLRGRKMK